MKQERDRAKKAKAAAKRERRAERSEAGDESPTDIGEGAISPDELLTLVAKLQEDLESGRIDLEEFEERKADLAARLDLS